MANETFKAGDGASYNIGGDSYPVTIRKVSPAGKMIWASRDDFRASKKGNSFAQSDKIGVFKPLDVPESQWERYTLRQDGYWRPVGSRRCGYLSAGRSFRQDPHF